MGLGWSTTTVLRVLVIGCLLSLGASNLVALAVFVRTAEEHPTDEVLTRMDQLQGTQLQVSRAVMPLNDYLITREPRYLEAYGREVGVLRTRLSAAHIFLAPETARRLDAGFAKLHDLGQRIVRLSAEEGTAAHESTLMVGFDAAGEELVVALEEPIRDQQVQLEGAREQGNALRARATLLVLGIGTVNALGLGLMLVISRSISRRVRHLIERTRRLFSSHGADHPPPAGGHGHDELGELARSIDTAHQSRDATVRTERLAAIGELAVAMRHEINNPLQAITLLAENVKEQAGEAGNARLQETCEMLQQGCAELHDRVRKLSAVLDGPSVPYAGKERMKDIHAPNASAPGPALPIAPDPSHASK